MNGIRDKARSNGTRCGGVSGRPAEKAGALGEHDIEAIGFGRPRSCRACFHRGFGSFDIFFGATEGGHLQEVRTIGSLIVHGFTKGEGSRRLFEGIGLGAVHSLDFGTGNKVSGFDLRLTTVFFEQGHHGYTVLGDGFGGNLVIYIQLSPVAMQC